MAVGFQLGYTVVFGWYASFLFMRTGHLIASLVTHIFCNYMGLPFIYSKRKVASFLLLHKQSQFFHSKSSSFYGISLQLNVLPSFPSQLEQHLLVDGSLFTSSFPAFTFLEIQ